MYQFAGTLVDFIVAISAVLILKNVWALVLGLLAGNIARCLVSYLIHPYRTKLNFDLEKTKELFGFGKWILGSSILIFLIRQGNDIFVGKLLGVTALGFYQMAYKISNMPATEYSNLIATVIFPAYSKIQDNLPRLKEVYLKVIQFTVFLSIPIAVLIVVLASDFTKIFLGIKWMPIVPAMQVLCVSAIARSVNGAISPVFRGIGMSEVITFGIGFQLIILIVIIYLLIKIWGILGASLSITIPNILIMIYFIKKLVNIMKYSLTHLIRSIISPIVGSNVMCIAILFFRIWWDENLVNFLLSILFGITGYFIIVYKIDKIFNYGMKHILVQLFKEIGIK